ncbi:hypothetical protein [methanotrophic endosymbiont of Bathymodiolus puteoserpentis (Logatchev)]|uniref:hypothetical protein n=1 Tax=methanotrophic endosymbiont of Bathymodiolus puteoserpentis (Logatchev) TaxID=343235 RepID=UPI001FDA1E56|nr:hypothetical protein [methanotrophic endosymbiont of Bathymodiolus puteoserpentis (Logatchev)]
MANAMLDSCINAKPRLDLYYASGIAGIRFDNLVTIKIDINDKLINNGFPLLTMNQRTVTQADFFRLSEAIRTEVVKLLGAKADRPAP